MCLTISTIGNSCIASNEGFEKAFKKAAQKKTVRAIFDSSSNELPIAQPLLTPVASSANTHTYLPQTTAQIVEEKEYFSMDPRVQKFLLNKMRKEGSFDTTLLESSRSLIKYYHNLQKSVLHFFLIALDEMNWTLLHIYALYTITLMK